MTNILLFEEWKEKLSKSNPTQYSTFASRKQEALTAIVLHAEQICRREEQRARRRAALAATFAQAASIAMAAIPLLGINLCIYIDPQTKLTLGDSAVALTTLFAFCAAVSTEDKWKGISQYARDYAEACAERARDPNPYRRAARATELIALGHGAMQLHELFSFNKS